MLVLSRKPEEWIYITTPDGTILKLVIVQVCGKKARIGIEAPSGYVILRKELWDEQQGDGKAAQS